MQGELFDSGILGTSNFEWIGQIADDSVWRDNITAAPFESEYENQGWGRRYKVRILGLHDQGETEIPSKDLPWAQIEYPVTAGSGNAASLQSPNLRQGNMVRGYFLDGQAMGIPIIRGIIGNNSQTQNALTIGDNRVTNNQPGSLAVSGYSTGQKPKDPRTGEKETPPDSDLRISRPGVSPEAAPIPSRVQVNRFGLRPDRDRSREQDADATLARTEADRRGLVGQEREDYVLKAVADGIERRRIQANNPKTSPSGSPFRENPDVQQITAGDVKRDDLLDEKTVMATPDDPVGSAMKAMQTIIENITKKIDKYLNAIQSYVDAVTSTITNIKKAILDAGREMAKYMKVIFDKIMEFVLKQINVVMSKVVAALPTNLRNLFGDLKEYMNTLILGVYNGMLDGLADQISQGLFDSLKPDERAREASRVVYNSGDEFVTRPKSKMVFAEGLAATVLSKNKDTIEESGKSVVQNLNGFVDSIQGDINAVSTTLTAGQNFISDGLGGFVDTMGDFGSSTSIITDGMSGGLNMMPDITSSLGSALSFSNIIMNVFPSESIPKKAISDFHQLATGCSGTISPELPSLGAIGAAAASNVNSEGVDVGPGADRRRLVPDPPQSIPFATPQKTQPDVNFSPEDRTLALEIALEDDAVQSAINAELERARSVDRSGMEVAIQIY